MNRDSVDKLFRKKEIQPHQNKVVNCNPQKEKKILRRSKVTKVETDENEFQTLMFNASRHEEKLKDNFKLSLIKEDLNY